jgi:hypothetical protein
MHLFTGPWQIVESPSGTSHTLKFTSNPKQRKKKQASNLLPYLPELIPFQPVDGHDNQYSQLYKPIQKSSYKEAGINGFEPPQPFAINVHFARRGNF